MPGGHRGLHLPSGASFYEAAWASEKVYSSLNWSARLSTTGTLGFSRLNSEKVRSLTAVPVTRPPWNCAVTFQVVGLVTPLMVRLPVIWKVREPVVGSGPVRPRSAVGTST